jgi:hypothetical protein
MVREFGELSVNRRAYTIQSVRPHPESGRHYYYRPKSKDGGKPVGLSLEIVRQHLAGELTIGIYAINPATRQQSRLSGGPRGDRRGALFTHNRRRKLLAATVKPSSHAFGLCLSTFLPIYESGKRSGAWQKMRLNSVADRNLALDTY